MAQGRPHASAASPALLGAPGRCGRGSARGFPHKGRTYTTALLHRAGSSHVGRGTGAESTRGKAPLSLQAGRPPAEEEDHEDPRRACSFPTTVPTRQPALGRAPQQPAPSARGSGHNTYRHRITMRNASDLRNVCRLYLS